MPGTPENPALARLRELARNLPESEVELAGRHAGFSVRKRRFAWFTDDHHGDGMLGLAVKVPAGENHALAGSDPTRFFLPSYLGSRGWIGVRLDRPATDWEEVRELLTESYRLVAPKSLTSRLGGPV